MYGTRMFPFARSNKTSVSGVEPDPGATIINQILNTMKVKTRDQQKTEYDKYLQTKAMTERFTPTLRAIGQELKHLKNWRADFGTDNRIMFVSDHEGTDLNQFLEVVEAVERHFDVTLKRSFQDHLGVTDFYYLGATGYVDGIEYRNGRFRPSIDIRMFGIDKCEIEYVEEVVKKPKLSGFCAEVIE